MNSRNDRKKMKICRVRNTTVTKKKVTDLSWLFLSSSYSDIQAGLFPCCPSQGTSVWPPDQIHWLRERDQHFNSRSNLRQVTCASISIWSIHTSPAKGTGQLAAQEATSDDSDGIDVSGNLIQRLEVLNLKREKNWHGQLPGQPSMLCQWDGCIPHLTSQWILKKCFETIISKRIKTTLCGLKISYYKTLWTLNC